MIRTHDKDLIKSIMTSVDGFDHVVNYYNPNIIYLYEDGCLFGCAPTLDFVSCHVAILKESRGKKAVEAGKRAVKWLQDNTGYRIFARTEKHLKHARIYNNMIGLRRFSENDRFVFYGVNI